jgi:hypothetical protein
MRGPDKFNRQNRHSGENHDEHSLRGSTIIVTLTTNAMIPAMRKSAGKIISRHILQNSHELDTRV